VRDLCPHCRRPLLAWIPLEGTQETTAVEGACFCDRITRLVTKTRIVLLQHPRERDMAIGTARMAHLALPNARLTVGVRFSEDPEIVAAASRNEAYVLFPGPGSRPVETLPAGRPVTLVVVDGTWSQAKKILKANPLLRALPRIGFTPRRPSGYLIRKEPSADCVSTIEALAEVLRTLEPDGDRFERLLDPFHAMVARQRWFESTVAASRHRNALRKPKVPARVLLAERLASFGDRLVCIHGEANSWPHTAPDRPEPELVHWLAHRPATRETFEMIVRPRHPLGSKTCEHVELSEPQLRSGRTIEDCRDAWTGFIRSDDVLVLWGAFYRDLARKEGLSLENPAIDLRDETSRVFKRKMGTLDKATETVGSTPVRLELLGRGGRRLNAMVGALEELRASKLAETASL
jgi:DTW domain-containing protein YfiP